MEVLSSLVVHTCDSHSADSEFQPQPGMQISWQDPEARHYSVFATLHPGVTGARDVLEPGCIIIWPLINYISRSNNVGVLSVDDVKGSGVHCIRFTFERNSGKLNVILFQPIRSSAR